MKRPRCTGHRSHAEVEQAGSDFSTLRKFHSYFIVRFDRGYQLGNDARMSGLAKKIIAVFFAVWLPLFSGSVLAASVQMASHHHCQDEMMADMDMSGHHMSGADDEQNPTCDACAVCHLACTVIWLYPAWA